MKWITPILAVSFLSGAIFGGGLKTNVIRPNVDPGTSPPGRSDRSDTDVSNITEEGPNLFAWGMVESTNLSALVGNLRFYGCPEQTIFYVAEGRIKVARSREYAATPSSGNYARPQVEMRERMQRKARIDGEINSALLNQFHLSPPPRSAGIIFTAEDEQRIADAATLYPRISTDYSNHVSIALGQTNRLNRLNYLSACLDSEKMQYYKLDREGVAVRVGNFSKNMHPSRVEFFAIAGAIEGKDTTLKNGVFSPDLAQSLEAVLSPDRFLLLQNLQHEEIKAVFTFAMFNGLPEEVADSLAQLRMGLQQNDLSNYKSQVEALIKDSKMVSLYLNNKSIHPNLTWDSSH